MNFTPKNRRMVNLSDVIPKNRSPRRVAFDVDLDKPFDFRKLEVNRPKDWRRSISFDEFMHGYNKNLTDKGSAKSRTNHNMYCTSQRNQKRNEVFE